MKKQRFLAYMGMLLAVAFVLSYIETLIPLNFGVPGIKLGLGNLAVVTALYTIGIGPAIVLAIMKVLLVTFTFGSFSMFMYSFTGALLSVLVMALLKKLDIFSCLAVSATGGIMHNVGQILVAVLITKEIRITYYLPVLIVSGVVTGAVLGIIAGLIVKRVSKVLKVDYER